MEISAPCSPMAYSFQEDFACMCLTFTFCLCFMLCLCCACCWFSLSGSVVYIKWRVPDKAGPLRWVLSWWSAEATYRCWTQDSSAVVECWLFRVSYCYM